MYDDFWKHITLGPFEISSPVEVKPFWMASLKEVHISNLVLPEHNVITITAMTCPCGKLSLMLLHEENLSWQWLLSLIRGQFDLSGKESQVAVAKTVARRAEESSINYWVQKPQIGSQRSHLYTGIYRGYVFSKDPTYMSGLPHFRWVLERINANGLK